MITYKNAENFLNVSKFFSDVHVETLALFALPYIFKPVLAKAKSKTCPQTWRAGKVEIAEGFIYNIPVNKVPLYSLNMNQSKSTDYQ